VPAPQAQLTSALAKLRQTFVVADATHPDCPLIYASEGFYHMTGYSQEELVGKNWYSFLQGPDTDPQAVRQLDEAVEAGRPLTLRLLCYRKSGKAFWNMLTMTPIHDDEGNVVKIVGVQVDVSRTTEGRAVQCCAQGLPLLVHYDERLKERVAWPATEEVMAAVSPRASRLSRASHHGPRSFSLSMGGAGGEEEACPHRAALDLATTIERIQTNFVISDPSLPDCPIVFASDSFLQLTGYAREDILGRNCRFLQGPGTDRATVNELRAAILAGRECTVRMLNYTKAGKPFWNLLTVAPIRDGLGVLRFIVGIQVDVTEQPQPEGAAALGGAAPRGLRDAKAVGRALQSMGYEGGGGGGEDDLWAGFGGQVAPVKPHKAADGAWAALRAAAQAEGRLTEQHFTRVRQLGAGNVGKVELVELAGSCHRFALKSLDKREMVERNKVGRVHTERRVLSALDHPFLVTLYATMMETDTAVQFLLEYCPGSDLHAVLHRAPYRRLPEAAVRRYATEVVSALQYLHLQGFAYRDLNPENIMVHEESGHCMLTDFNLSYWQAGVEPELVLPPPPPPPRQQRAAGGGAPAAAAMATASSLGGAPSGSPRAGGWLLAAAPSGGRANSFVGTEEYLAPEVVKGTGHDSGVDWWSFGILLFELLFGYTPFKGLRRDETFDNIVKMELAFPKGGAHVSPQAKDLITRLLAKDPRQRLGAHAGADEVKQHPWFDGVNWALGRADQ
ncbi:hypothetical protein CHLNCDRAFT_6687, partial [Chlorella variabilis]